MFFVETKISKINYYGMEKAKITAIPHGKSVILSVICSHNVDQQLKNFGNYSVEFS
jgi:hypothetical protein